MQKSVKVTITLTLFIIQVSIIIIKPTLLTYLSRVLFDIYKFNIVNIDKNNGMLTIVDCAKEH